METSTSNLERAQVIEASRPPQAAKSAAGAVITVESPIDGTLVGKVKAYSLEEAREVLTEVRAAQKAWGAHTPSERAAVMDNFARILNERADEVAQLLSRETGKPLYEAYLCEVLPIVHLAAYYARRAPQVLGPQRIPLSVFLNRSSYVHYRPRGVVFIISPWNFPFTIPCGEVISSLVAGNGVLLKPASLTPLVALKMRELFIEAGLDPQVFQVIPSAGSVASKLIDQAHDAIDYVNFTGSTQIGRTVAELCGRHLLPCSMELGGKDPAIVCRDADVDLAARAICFGAFCNSGQICASVERAYVHREVYDRFVARMVTLVQSLRQESPLEGVGGDVGAMTSAEQIEQIEAQVREARERGARILSGGQRHRAGHMYYAPTVLVDVDQDMQVVSEESFGPLLPIMRVEDEEEAIRLANDTPYGLSAYVFSRDIKRARRIAERLEAGTVMINDTLITHAFPEAPWSGMKASGIGRVHSDEALRDLSLACHVNYDRIPLPRLAWGIWTWPPYSEAKVARFKALLALVDLKGGLKEKAGLALKVLWPRAMGS